MPLRLTRFGSAVVGGQPGEQVVDRTLQSGQWPVLAMEAVPKVAEHRFGPDGEREYLGQRQLGVEPDNLVAPGVKLADQCDIAGRRHGPTG